MSRLHRLYGGRSHSRKPSHCMALPIGSTPHFNTSLILPLQPPSFNWIYDWRSKSSKASKSTPRHQSNHWIHSQCKSAPAKRAKSAPVQIDHCFHQPSPELLTVETHDLRLISRNVVIVVLLGCMMLFSTKADYVVYILMRLPPNQSVLYKQVVGAPNA